MVKLPQQEVSFHFQYQIPKSKTVDVWIELSLPLKGTCEDHIQQYVKEFRSVLNLLADYSSWALESLDFPKVRTAVFMI